MPLDEATLIGERSSPRPPGAGAARGTRPRRGTRGALPRRRGIARYPGSVTNPLSSPPCRSRPGEVCGRSATAKIAGARAADPAQRHLSAARSGGSRHDNLRETDRNCQDQPAGDLEEVRSRPRGALPPTGHERHLTGDVSRLRRRRPRPPKLLRLGELHRWSSSVSPHSGGRSHLFTSTAPDE